MGSLAEELGATDDGHIADTSVEGNSRRLRKRRCLGFRSQCRKTRWIWWMVSGGRQDQRLCLRIPCPMRVWRGVGYRGGIWRERLLLRDRSRDRRTINALQIASFPTLPHSCPSPPITAPMSNPEYFSPHRPSCSSLTSHDFLLVIHHLLRESLPFVSLLLAFTPRLDVSHRSGRWFSGS